MTQGKAAAAVELYEDEVGGLYIFPEGEENGFYVTGKVPGGLFKKDASRIAGGDTEFWRADLPGANRSQALNVGATHVASWENDEVTVHRRPGSNARSYLGMG